MVYYPSDVYESEETKRKYPYRLIPLPSREAIRSRNCLRVEFFGPLPRCFLAPKSDDAVRSRDCFPHTQVRQQFWDDFEYCLGPGCAGCPRVTSHESRKDPPGGRLRARSIEKQWWMLQEVGGQWITLAGPYQNLKEIVSIWKVQRGPSRRDADGVYIPLLWAHTAITTKEVSGSEGLVMRVIETAVFEEPPWPFEIR